MTRSLEVDERATPGSPHNPKCVCGHLMTSHRMIPEQIGSRIRFCVYLSCTCKGFKRDDG